MPVRDRFYRACGKVIHAYGRLRQRAHHWRTQPSSDDRPNAQFQRALLAVEQQDDAGAIAALQSVLADPAAADWHPAAQRQLLQIYHRQGAVAQGIPLGRALIQADPKTATNYQLLGKLYLAADQLDPAISHLQTAVNLDPNDPWSQFHLGEALVKRGLWTAAIAPLQQAIGQLPEFCWAHFYLAEAHSALGNLDLAWPAALRATDCNPEHPHLRQYADYLAQLQTQLTELTAYVQQAQQRDADDRAAGRKRIKPRVLFLTPVPAYPPTTGGVIRMFHHLRSLRDQVELVIASRFYLQDLQTRADLAPYAEFVLTVDASNRPPLQPGQSKLVNDYNCLYFRQLLQQLSAANFDIVVAEFTYMAQYRDLFPRAFHVLSEHNIESQLVRRQAQIEAPPPALVAQIGLAAAIAVGLREADALAEFETEMWPQFPLRYVVSDLDRQQIMARCPTGETIVVNNGADTQAIPLLPDQSTPRILLFGTLNYFPNIDAAFYLVNEILPLVWAVNDAVEFWVAGANPSAELVELIGRDHRLRLIANPEDMSDVARECCLSVVPLRSGGGTRIKILHALAMGLPTITTSLGCEGLAVADGQHLLIRDRPEDFAAAIVTLLADAEQREALRRSGRNLVAAKYDWQRIFDQAVGLMIDRWQQWRDRANTSQTAP
ncbi:MAG: hypothetical protein RLZZ511_2662 [Cyanobacteriota bacterium]|jgi:glycosyltransferase involved in cell wall biosynthesis